VTGDGRVASWRRYQDSTGKYEEEESRSLSLADQAPSQEGDQAHASLVRRVRRPKDSEEMMEESEITGVKDADAFHALWSAKSGAKEGGALPAPEPMQEDGAAAEAKA